MRFDLYTAIHKTQRFHLGRLAERIGRTDASQPEMWPDLGAEVRTWLRHLKAHAQHEHDFIHPLFARCDNSAQRLDTEHEALEHAMDGLEQTVSAGSWSDLYARFVAFLGAYFVHVAEEEKLQAAVLLPCYSDAELAEVFVRFRQGRSAEDASRDLQLMLPALSLDELTRMYESMRQSAPPATWEAAMTMARQTLTLTDMRKLEVRLSASA